MKTLLLALTLSVPAFASNVIPIYLNAGSPGQDIPSVSVTICEPGSSRCQTIQHIEVDTASTGLRIYASAIKINLQKETDAHGNSIGDCAWNYWGYIHTADVKLGSYTATNIPIEVIEINDPNTPAECGTDDEYSPSTHNGIIGISPSLVDTMPWGYYTCDSTGCHQGNVSVSLQTPNIIPMFSTDNNGYAVQLPAISAQGAKAVTGQIIMGIGTHANNQPPAGLMPIVPDETWGEFKVKSGGKVYTSAFDSGTWSYNVPYLNKDLCPQNTPYLCPQAPVSVAVDILDASATVVHSVNIEIADFSQFPTDYMAFNNLGTAFPDSEDLMLGLPFFFGKTIFFAMDQAETTPELGPGPWVGY